MSDVSDCSERLNLREQVVRFDRLGAETQMFRRAANKLRDEERKFDRDRLLAPSLGIAGILAGLVAEATLVLHATGQ